MLVVRLLDSKVRSRWLVAKIAFIYIGKDRISFILVILSATRWFKSGKVSKMVPRFRTYIYLESTTPEVLKTRFGDIQKIHPSEPTAKNPNYSS